MDTDRCVSCGHILPTNALTCPQCGTRPPRRAFCTKCGGSVAEDTRFCPTCGAPRYENNLPIEKGAASPMANPSATRSRANIVGWSVFGTGLVAVVVSVIVNVRLFWLTHSRPGNPSSNCISQPSFVGEVGIEREGDDGLAVWFSVEDSGNNDTCTNGVVDIRIFGGIENDGDVIYPSPISPIYNTARELRPTDFATWKVTNSITGASSEKLIWHSRRISYEDLHLARNMVLPRGYTVGQAEVVVHPTDDGPPLTGRSHEPFYFYK